jgi:hypothetical protein
MQFVEAAPAEPSHVSLSSRTGSASTRVFQMFEPGKIRQRDPGTGWATAAEGAIAEPTRREASAFAARFR